MMGGTGSGSGRPWPPEDIQRAMALWADGKSCLEISRALDDRYSRSALSGKLHRLGVLCAGAPQRPGKLSAVPKPKSTRGPKVAPIAPPVYAKSPEAMVRDFFAGAGGCLWPIGDPRDPEFRQCGDAKADFRYCAKHKAMGVANPRPDRGAVQGALARRSLPVPTFIRMGRG
jgi:GcrA cell cycle regulator